MTVRYYATTYQDYLIIEGSKATVSCDLNHDKAERTTFTYVMDKPSNVTRTTPSSLDTMTLLAALQHRSLASYRYQLEQVLWELKHDLEARICSKA